VSLFRSLARVDLASVGDDSVRREIDESSGGLNGMSGDPGRLASVTKV